MNIIILGGTGFVGSHLARRLHADGHTITIATRYAPGARHLTVLPGLKVRQCNPYDIESLTSALEGQQAAINLVGILNERGFGGKGFARAHVELVEKLMIACEAARVERLVHMSALNAGNGDSYYLKTRGEAEAMLQRTARGGQQHVTIFRPSTIFGPDDSFLNRFATLLRISPVLPLARPTARFAPVYVGDVVEAFARTLAEPPESGRVFELCGAEVWELKALVEWLRDQLGLRRAVVGLPDALGRLQGAAFDLVPGKPFSSDNFKSLLVDSVCSEDGFAALGIEPWGMSALAPTWLASAGRQQRYQGFRRRARRDPPGER